MGGQRLFVLAVVSAVSLTIVSCGVFGSDDSDDSGLKIEYRLHHQSTLDDWDWQRGQDSLRVFIGVLGEVEEGDGDVHTEVVSRSLLFGEVRVSRDVGERVQVTGYIPTRESWHAELAVSWGDNRKVVEGSRSPEVGRFPKVTVPLNEQ